MPTDLHQSVVQKFTDGGYRVGGEQELSRLAYYLNEVLGIDGSGVLLEYFKSGKVISHHSTTRLARKVAASLGEASSPPDYASIRAELPVPTCRPDAWLYRPSQELCGAMAIEFVEVFDTCKTGLAKLAQYGRAFSEHTRTQLMVFEIGARDGSHVRHDPLYALQLMVARDLWWMFEDGDIEGSELAKQYAEWLGSGRRIVPTAMLERCAA